jgi:Uma2 family endonuclease
MQAYPTASQLFDYSTLHEDDMAVYGPYDHQRVIAKLTTELGILYYKTQAITLEPLPEAMLNDGEASPVPDVILTDNQTHQTPIIIEVCHTKGLKKDLKKVKQLIDEDNYGIQEGFVYDYIAEEWHQYRQDGGWQLENRSFSAVLNLDFGPFL